MAGVAPELHKMGRHLALERSILLSKLLVNLHYYDDSLPVGLKDAFINALTANIGATIKDPAEQAAALDRAATNMENLFAVAWEFGAPEAMKGIELMAEVDMEQSQDLLEKLQAAAAAAMAAVPPPSVPVSSPSPPITVAQPQAPVAPAQQPPRAAMQQQTQATSPPAVQSAVQSPQPPRGGMVAMAPTLRAQLQAQLQQPPVAGGGVRPQLPPQMMNPAAFAAVVAAMKNSNAMARGGGTVTGTGTPGSIPMLPVGPGTNAPMVGMPAGMGLARLPGGGFALHNFGGAGSEVPGVAQRPGFMPGQVQGYLRVPVNMSMQIQIQQQQQQIQIAQQQQQQQQAARPMAPPQQFSQNQQEQQLPLQGQPPPLKKEDA